MAIFPPIIRSATGATQQLQSSDTLKAGSAVVGTTALSGSEVLRVQGVARFDSVSQPLMVVDPATRCVALGDLTPEAGILLGGIHQRAGSASQFHGMRFEELLTSGTETGGGIGIRGGISTINDAIIGTGSQPPIGALGIAQHSSTGTVDMFVGTAGLVFVGANAGATLGNIGFSVSSLASLDFLDPLPASANIDNAVLFGAMGPTATSGSLTIGSLMGFYCGDLAPGTGVGSSYCLFISAQTGQTWGIFNQGAPSMHNGSLYLGNAGSPASLLLEIGGTNSETGIELGDGSGVGVSSPGKARIRFNGTDVQVSTSGSAFASLALAGSSGNGFVDAGAIVHLETNSDTLSIGSSSMVTDEKVRIVGKLRVDDGSNIMLGVDTDNRCIVVADGSVSTNTSIDGLRVRTGGATTNLGISMIEEVSTGTHSGVIIAGKFLGRLTNTATLTGAGNFIIGAWGSASHESSSTATNMTGVLAESTVSGSGAKGTVDVQYGVFTNTGFISTGPTGAITTLIGYQASSPRNTGASRTIGTAIGFRAADQGSANTTTAIGISIADQTSSSVNWALKSDAACPSGFAGNMRLGDVSSQATIRLELTGSNSTCGLSMVDGASVGVSASNTGRFIYNATAQRWQISENTGSYANVATETGKVKNLFFSGTSGEAITVGELVCMDDASGNPRVFRADANGSGELVNVLGVAASTVGGSGSALDVTTGGEVSVADARWDSTPATSDVGKAVYLSENVGKWTLTAPSTSGSTKARVGWVTVGGTGAVKVSLSFGEPSVNP